MYVVYEVAEWIRRLDSDDRARVTRALEVLAEVGPGRGTTSCRHGHRFEGPELEEPRPGTVRILFALDPWRSYWPPETKQADGRRGTARRSPWPKSGTNAA